MSNIDAQMGLSRTAKWLLNLAYGPRRGSQVTTTIDRWLQTNGTEWTVSRLKAYWAAALQLRAGNHEVAKGIYSANWIAYRKDTLIPKGPMGYAVELFVTAQRPAVIRRAAAMLRVYTTLTLDSTSLKQYDKAKAAINQPSSADETVLEVSKALLSRHLRRNQSVYTAGPLQAPDLRRLKAFSSYDRVRVISNRDLEKLPYGKLAVSLVTNPYIPPSLRGLNPLEDVRQNLLYLTEDMIDPDDEPSTLGSIAFLQEGGAKARVVAAPNAWTQWLFEPLHRELDNLIRGLQCSAVHDQNKGAFFLERHIRSGNGVWCFDLSSATDRFPLVLQTQVLRHLGLSTYAEALEEATWNWSPSVFDPEDGPGPWTYASGQPMGLYGSFPLFHLTHYILLSSIEEEVNEQLGLSLTGSFLVLGDDVIITNEDVALLYRNIMSDLGVSLSPSKSINSMTTGEFAGFVGVKTNKSVSVFRPYKWGRTNSIKNILPFLYGFGEKVRQVSQEWERKARLFQRTRSLRNPDLSPLIGSDDRPGIKDIPALDPHRLYQLLMQVNYPASDLIYGRWSEGLLDSRPLEEACFVFLGKEYGMSITDRKIDFPSRDETDNFSVSASFSADPLIREESKREKAREPDGNGLINRDPTVKDSLEERKSNPQDTPTQSNVFG